MKTPDLTYYSEWRNMKQAITIALPDFDLKRLKTFHMEGRNR